jgi:hypothetical protein
MATGTARPTYDASKYLIGRGALLIDRLNPTTGARVGLINAGDVEKVTETPNDDVAERIEMMDDQAILSDRTIKLRKPKITVTFREWKSKILALRAFANLTTYTQLGTAVVAEALGAVQLDLWYRLANLNVSAVVLKKGVTVLVDGTDYEWDGPSGMVHILPGSVTVVNGDSLTADYSRTAISAPGLDVIQGGAVNFIDCAMLFLGKPRKGPKLMLEVWKASVVPSGDLALISEDYSNLDMEFSLYGDPVGHANDPYYRITYLP